MQSFKRHVQNVLQAVAFNAQLLETEFALQLQKGNVACIQYIYKSRLLT